MRYGVLGPVEAVRAGDRIPLGGPKQRLVLTLMLLEPGRLRSADRLIDLTWADDTPAQARHTLQAYMSRLRRLLDDPIVNEGGGYRLEVDPDAVDAIRFERLVRLGRAKLAADNPAEAAETLRAALDCWRGEPFGDLAVEPALRGEAVRLGELRLGAVADRIDADLVLGRHVAVIDELDVLCREHPFDERLRGLHMRALYGAGRQRDALIVYARTRETFVEELGLDPSPALDQLHHQILTHDRLLDTAIQGLDAADALPMAIRGYELRAEVRRLGSVRWTRAYQRVPGRESMLRICGPDIANEPAFVATFETSALALADVEHPHLLSVDDYWRDPSGACVAWRWLRGGPLSLRFGQRAVSDQHVGDDRPDASVFGGLLEPAAVLAQVCGAIDALHRHGIAHGDVCADTILLDLDGHAFLSPPLIGETDRPPSFEADLAALQVVADALMRQGRASHDVPTFGGRMDGGQRMWTPEGAASDAEELVGEVRNPYKGLRAFQESDANDFYGRRVLTDELVAAVRAHRLVAVVGPSGIGKSSVVRAGLVPAVRRGSLGATPWLVTDMHPGGSPFDELESALLRVAVSGQGDLRATLTGHPFGLVHLCDEILPPQHSLLLVIDQFEELFSMVPSERRAPFIEALTAAATEEQSRCRIVITLRADAFDQPLGLHTFGELVRGGLVTVAFPSNDDLVASIVQPAHTAGLQLEPGLVDEIVREVRDQPGGLPLLQHALTELVERRENRTLTRAAARASGGITGALGRRAEELYQSLDTAHRSAAEQLFLRLVDVGENENRRRCRVRYSDLMSMDLGIGAVDDVAKQFAAHRLLTFDRDPVTRGPTIEVAHEALFTAWDRLAGWIAERHDDLRNRRRLAAAAGEWAESGHDESFLLSGGRLDHMRRWTTSTDLHLTEAELCFVHEGVAREESWAAAQRRRRRVVVSALGVVAVFSTAFAVIATMEGRRADRAATAATAEARRSDAARLATRSAQLLDDDLDTALLLSVEARHRDVNAETNAALWNALSASVPARQSPRGVLRGFVHPALDSLGSLDVDAAGQHAVFGGDGDGHGLAVYVDLESGVELDSLESDGSVTAVSIIGDGSVVVATDEGSLVRWWPQDDVDEVVMRAAGGDPIVSIDGSHDGATIATGSERGDVVVWPLTDADRSPRPLAALQHTPATVAFSRNGMLATTWAEGAAALWDPAAASQIGPPLVPVDPGPPIASLSFSGDGRYLAGAPVQGTVTVWALDGPGGPSVVTSFADMSPHALSFDPAAPGVLVVGGGTGQLIVADVRGAQPVASRPGWGAVDGALAFASDGSTLLTGGANGTAARWTSTTGDTAISEPMPADWISARASSDGALVVGWARDADLAIRRVQLVELATGRVITRFSAAGASSGCCVLDVRLDATSTTLVVETAARLDFTGRAFTFIDVATGSVMSEFTVDESTLANVAFDVAPGGDTLAAITPAGVEIWDRSGRRVATLASSANASALAFVADGDLAVAFGGPDPRLAVFDRDDWQLSYELVAPAVVRTLAVDPTRRMLVGGGADGLVTRWDMTRREALLPWRADVGTIVQIAVAADGSVIAAGLASTVSVLDPDGQPLGVATTIDSRIGPVSFAADDREAIVATAHGVRRFLLDSDSWERTACAMAGRELTSAEWATNVGTEPQVPTC
ncbi:MAG TPA: BTAD domain-containing putative transcriptional regulator, partial [Ilumatobacteraceae bacterium]|nr:BTAD domain-containing putative transcriptional regulator [Ilumatobacteraceae bacterium]